MATFSFTYTFRVPLAASADRAYRWSTDFRPGDPALMGEVGTRTVEKLTKDTFVLTDVVPDHRRSVRKVRVVRLLPKTRQWTNTHIGGPYVHSQFFYTIEPRGRNRSQLTFTGLQVEYPKRRPGAAAIARRAREVARKDRAAWVHLARALKKDLARSR